MKPRRPATVSVDLDDQWAYLKSVADPEWTRCATFLDRAVPRLLALFSDAGLKATFFVVGRDAADPASAGWLREIVSAGHEVANHSHSHDIWLCAHDEARIEAEIALAEEAIVAATGICPVGFRGPGFAVDDRIIRILVRRGYRYDASTWPTVAAAATRWWFFLSTRMPADERRRRAAMGGRMRDAFRPIRTYHWQTTDGGLLEVPVTTMPWARLPMHPTFLQVPAGLSRRMARAWFACGLVLCQLHGIAPSVLFHPTDVLGMEDGGAPAFIPGTRRPVASKLELARDVLTMLSRRFDVMPLGAFAEAVCASAPMAGR